MSVHAQHDTCRGNKEHGQSVWQRFVRWFTSIPEARPEIEPRPKELREAPQWLLEDIGVGPGYMYRQKPRRLREREKNKRQGG